MGRIFVILLVAAVQNGFGQNRPNGGGAARLSGFSDEVTEKDGKIARLDIEVKIDVFVAGTYRLTLDLVAANGNSLSGHARAALGQGRQILTASFSPQELINYLGQDGPYRISDVRLAKGANSTRLYADRMALAGITRTLHLSDLYAVEYYFTGEIQAAGAGRMPSGKFASLNVNIGVVTPGARCSGWGTLSDESGQGLDFENAASGQDLPPGKSMFKLQFQGAKIAQRWGNSALAVKGLAIVCSGKTIGDGHEVHYPGKLRMSGFWSSDFDDSQPDFELLAPDQPVRIAAGDATFLKVKTRIVGGLETPIEVTAHVPDPRIRIAGLEQPIPSCQGFPSCWQDGAPFSAPITTAAELPVGTYRIQFEGRAAGKEHTAEFDLVVDAELTRRKRQNAAGIARLMTEDAIPPSAPAAAPAPSPIPEELQSAAKFSADVALRKIHAVLVLQRSGSMMNTCQFMLAAATRFSRLFAEGRDSLGVISYGSTVQLRMPLTDHFFMDAPNRISQIECFGSTNTGEALEIAQQQLARHEDPEALNAVILITNGRLRAMTAEWPIQARPADECSNPTDRCTAPPVVCTEVRDGILPAVLLPINSGASPYRVAFIPAGWSETEERHLSAFDTKRNSCFGMAAFASYAYMPEHDLHGVPFTGTKPLERYPSGPYAGKIRVDVMQNVMNAAVNQVDNAARELRSVPKNAPLVYVIGIADNNGASLDDLRRLANDPRGSSYDQNQPSGMAILTSSPDEFFPAFWSVRQDLIQHATVK